MAKQSLLLVGLEQAIISFLIFMQVYLRHLASVGALETM